jgi:DNA-directed RNA polymerase subunit N
VRRVIIPVRCFSCGRVVASDYERFKAAMDKIRSTGRKPEDSEIEKTLDDLGVERYCCRRMILSHIDLIDEVLPFS